VWKQERYQPGADSLGPGCRAVHPRKGCGTDLNEAQLLELLDRWLGSIVVSVIGGLGFILGRGNQQISPRVIRKTGVANIQVVADEEKLLALRDNPLRVDTGDPEMDAELSGRGLSTCRTGCSRGKTRGPKD